MRSSSSSSSASSSGVTIIVRPSTLTIKTMVAAMMVAAMTLCVAPGAESFFAEWGPDLEGPWCARRAPGKDCCSGRDDNCAVPILGTECYCDIFCNDTGYDCCPDFWAHCYGVTRAPTTARPITLPTPRTTRPSEIVRCELNGVYYRPGDRVMDNCNECTCELYVTGGPRRYEMRCTQNVCLLRPDLIQAVNRGRYTWRAGNSTGLWGLTLKDGVQYRLGTFPLERDVLRMTPIKVRQDESLPETFDARRKWPDKLNPIRDQGNCASSWAFSTTAVASDRLSIESDGAVREELSAQHMLSCDTDGQGGCKGGKVDRAWFFMRRYGVVTEACYPYESGKKDVCRLPVRQRGGDCPSGIQYKREKRYKASPPYRIRPLEREIMKEIMDNGPVQAIFQVQEDFYMYRSGVYQYTDLTRNDPPQARLSDYHSVRILGWGVDRTPEGDIVKYWICANSWGPEWGENGYFRILRGVNANDIETYIVGAWGKVTGDVMLRQLLSENRRRRLQARGERPRSVRHISRSRHRRRRHHREGRRQLRHLTSGRGGKKGRSGRRGRGGDRGRREGEGEGPSPPPPPPKSLAGKSREREGRRTGEIPPCLLHGQFLQSRQPAVRRRVESPRNARRSMRFLDCSSTETERRVCCCSNRNGGNGRRSMRFLDCSSTETERRVCCCSNRNGGMELLCNFFFL